MTRLQRLHWQVFIYIFIYIYNIFIYIASKHPSSINESVKELEQMAALLAQVYLFIFILRKTIKNNKTVRQTRMEKNVHLLSMRLIAHGIMEPK